ncbi:MAG: zinc ribbon domain-containing protein [Ruminococcus sp.]|nr:zinc ribbon domain-containing protein [Ruminococcus sp.]
MICISCGKNIPEGSAFCNFCGTPTGAAQSRPQGIISDEPVQLTGFSNGGQPMPGSMNVPYPPSLQNGQDMQWPYQGQAMPGGEAKAKKDLKPLVITVLLIAALCAAAIAFVLLSKKDSEKILSAFSNTLNAPSFTCTGVLEDDRNGLDLDLEIYTKDGISRMYMGLSDEYGDDNEEISLYDGKFYVKHSSPDGTDYSIPEENEETRFIKQLCTRDFIGTCKNDPDIDKALKEMIKNYDQIPEIVSQMVTDCFKNNCNTPYVNSFRKDGSRYAFELDLYHLVKTAKKDHGLKVDADLINELKFYDMTVRLEFSIEKGYIKEFYGELEIEGVSVSAKLVFDNYNKVDPDKMEAVILAAEVINSGVAETPGKNAVKSANGNAKTAYNAAAEAMADLETMGLLGSDVSDAASGRSIDPGDMRYYSLNDVRDGRCSASDYVDSTVARILEETDQGGIFTVQAEDGWSFSVTWCRDLECGYAGRYPDPPHDPEEAQEIFRNTF